MYLICKSLFIAKTHINFLLWTAITLIYLRTLLNTVKIITLFYYAFLLILCTCYSHWMSVFLHLSRKPTNDAFISIICMELLELPRRHFFNYFIILERMSLHHTILQAASRRLDYIHSIQNSYFKHCNPLHPQQQQFCETQMAMRWKYQLIVLILRQELISLLQIFAKIQKTRHWWRNYVLLQLRLLRRRILHTSNMMK